ncbi:MAG: glutaredoxin 3 [Gammaproteobacteria bacterium]|nr:glutaredoxin 3 [Gammaproteobacteria bacterium]TVQ45087.1 MAG: glutaredoxin 3 [Gammaproteobacteria bacterium]
MTGAKVELYTTGWCGFCVRAKALLARKEVAFEEYRVDSQPALRAEMERRSSGARTVPQIFIDGHHVGGCDELHALEQRGELDTLLRRG